MGMYGYPEFASYSALVSNRVETDSYEAPSLYSYAALNVTYYSGNTAIYTQGLDVRPIDTSNTGGMGTQFYLDQNPTKAVCSASCGFSAGVSIVGASGFSVELETGF